MARRDYVSALPAWPRAERGNTRFCRWNAPASGSAGRRSSATGSIRSRPEPPVGGRPAAENHASHPVRPASPTPDQSRAASYPAPPRPATCGCGCRWGSSRCRTRCGSWSRSGRVPAASDSQETTGFARRTSRRPPWSHRPSDNRSHPVAYPENCRLQSAAPPTAILKSPCLQTIRFLPLAKSPRRFLPHLELLTEKSTPLRNASILV